MYKNAFPLAALLVSVLMLGCKPTEPSASGKQGKWISYPEQTIIRERQLRMQLRVEKREAMTNMQTDTGEVWFPSEIILYNEYGQPTLSQAIDAAGVVKKETRYEYQDSLLMRETVKESSGYSAATHYKYNAQGQKTEELMFQRGDSLLRRIYKLDALGNEMEVQLERFRDDTKFQLVTKRDALGQPLSVTEMQRGKPNWTETYSITDTLWNIRRTDSLNRSQGDFEMGISNHAVTRMVNRDETGKTRMSIIYTNDAQGRLLKEEHFGSQGQPMQATASKYDAQGLLIERIMTSPQIPQPVVSKYTYSFRPAPANQK